MHTGAILEITHYWDDSAGEELCRIWFCETLVTQYAAGPENCVCAEVKHPMPAVGEIIWVDEGRVYFSAMRRHLVAVGAPYPAPVAEDW